MALPDDITLASALADAAGAAIRPFFRAPYDIEAKADASPVTEADRAAELAMRGLLDAQRPADGIIGEEFGTVREGASRQWVLDPIDGTRSFIAGRPIFGTLIALMQDGWPILGIIDQPISGERWVGAMGQPTLFNGKPARTRRCRALEGAQLATTSPHLFSAHDGEHYLALAAAVAGDRLGQGPIYGGDCYNYGLLASGHVDIVCETGLKLHDFAALVPVVEGAGGHMCDWSGEPLHEASAGDVIAMGDPARLEDVIGALSHHHD
ncbi:MULTISPECIES: inositol monophosphatase family protein [Sphingobium]|uniref:inositol monophosphatase family protein n=1 Tax=Sphingobium TaxID=165695 RepID=UPI0015EC0914|nr:MULTISPECIES: inositol monophosphatase family protein [Sphingobium]MCW2362951.1 histidinol phosphatase-like enzyme (inositol monophosphatase family) [Sphingobium sp. B10D3B]MCW2400369.1 histidinol phosphatase-like enzyme (inositol monophosphatase family) [Sphingobium sp. B10D7B]MCW2407347.1 histidinol phosphatase-like enzyme (inositol monophosphatase family) [Sphingobium xanthum]